MRIPERNSAVFSTSAIDLFASALGAFILLVMLLFPYYRNAGSNEAFAKTREIMQQRNLAASDVDEMLSRLDLVRSELQDISRQNEDRQRRIEALRARLGDANRELAALPTPIPDVEVTTPEPPPPPIIDGVEFSILGLASESKSFVVLVDMSGSMINYEGLMLKSVLEILEPLDEDNRFAIVGFHGNPEPILWRYPGGTGMVAGSEENLRQAREFVRGLARKFVGSTPTHYALQAALEYPSNAVILMSDGAPNSPPGYIIQNISRLNQFRQTELHTVAIGDYTQNRELVLFLQSLARLNNGDFVGVSR